MFNVVRKKNLRFNNKFEQTFFQPLRELPLQLFVRMFVNVARALRHNREFYNVMNVTTTTKTVRFNKLSATDFSQGEKKQF